MTFDQPIRVTVGLDEAQGVVEVSFKHVDPEVFQHLSTGVVLQLYRRISSVRLDHREAVIAILPQRDLSLDCFAHWVGQALELMMRGTEFVFESHHHLCTDRVISLPRPRRPVLATA